MNTYPTPGGPVPRQPPPPLVPSRPSLSPGSDNKIWFITCGAIGCFLFVILIAFASVIALYFAVQKKGGTGGGPVIATGTGKACTTDSECTYPQYCILGTCKLLGNAGEGCAYDSDCNSPLYCKNSVCSSATGTATGASSVKGSACTSDADCMPPLYCIVSKCNPLGIVGDGCAKDYDCQYPYICTDGKCAVKPAGTGSYGTGSSTPGTPCKVDADCQPPLFCILQTCRYLGKTGDSCATSADCTMPLICEGGKCAGGSGGGSTGAGGTSPPVDVECKKDGDCAKKGPLFKYCIANQCRTTLASEGEACQYSTDCQQGLFCIVGVCRKEQSAKGEPCRSNDDCKRPLLCTDYVCS